MSEQAAGARAMKPRWWIALVLLLALLLAFTVLDLGRFAHLATLRPLQAGLAAFQAERPLLALAAYLAAFMLLATLSLPGSGVLTLLGGALFGLWVGLLAALVASSLGATLAMVCSRYLLRDFVRELAQARFATLLFALDRGIRRDGALYVFSVRLVPFFPFFIVNLLLGLTTIRVGVYFFASLLGLLPLTALYVNAGAQLARVQSPADVLSWPVALSFTLLALFPLLARRALAALARRRAAASA
jgi:uncharacterized membrane protein YdjX (TVP38/TMEM64 family)